MNREAILVRQNRMALDAAKLAVQEAENFKALYEKANYAASLWEENYHARCAELDQVEERLVELEKFLEALGLGPEDLP